MSIEQQLQTKSSNPFETTHQENSSNTLSESHEAFLNRTKDKTSSFDCDADHSPTKSKFKKYTRSSGNRSQSHSALISLDAIDSSFTPFKKKNVSMENNGADGDDEESLPKMRIFLPKSPKDDDDDEDSSSSSSDGGASAAQLLQN